MKNFIFIIVLGMLPIYSFAQKLEIAQDSAHAYGIRENLKSTCLNLHKQFLAGEITAYQTDSLNKTYTVAAFRKCFSRKRYRSQEIGNDGKVVQKPFDLAETYTGWAMSMEQQSDDLAKKVEREMVAIAPLYNLIIDGQNLGSYPCYYFKTRDVEKALNQRDYMQLIGMLKMSEFMQANYDTRVMQGMINNGEIHMEMVTPKANVNIVGFLMDEGTTYKLYAKQCQEVVKSLQAYLLTDLEGNLLNQEQAYTCYLDANLKNAIDDLAYYDAFKVPVVIQIPDPIHAGEFKDSTINMSLHNQKLESVELFDKKVKLVWGENTFYMKRKDFDAIVPEWIQVMLSEG